MSYLFISYAHAERQQVFGEYSFEKFTQDLMDAGYDLWIDTENLRGGMSWDDEIQKGVKGAAYVLALATRGAEVSDYIKRKEIGTAKKERKEIIPIMLGGDLHELGVSSSQGIDFTGDYEAAFRKLVASLTGLPPQHKQYDLNALLRKGTTSVEVAEKMWRTKISFGENTVALLIGRSEYGASAYIVTRRGKQFRVPETVQVFLQFTGERDGDDFDKYLRYIAADRHKSLWTVLIRGPYTKDDEYGWIYKLPNENDEVWKHCVRFIWDNIKRGGHGTQHLEMYLDAPNALVMALGASRNFSDYAIDVYNFNRGKPPIEKLYSRIYRYEGG